jgi:hypothetical protein
MFVTSYRAASFGTVTISIIKAMTLNELKDFTAKRKGFASWNAMPPELREAELPLIVQGMVAYSMDSFARNVHAMREAQTAYFRSRDRAVLERSKELEAQVDKQVAWVLAKTEPIPQPKQSSLF